MAYIEQTKAPKRIFLQLCSGYVVAIIGGIWLIDQYHGVAVQLIRHFDDAFDSRGYTRGCPDFLFTVFTYGAVSLLKIISVPVEGFETITQSILDLARRASDILAQAAVTRDHLPASQSALVTRLIEKSSAATKTADQVDYDFNQIIASMSTNVPSTGNDSSAVPFPDATAAQPVQLDSTHFNQNGDTTLSGQLNASSWFEPLPFNPLAPFDSDAIPKDPYPQDQDFFFSHESLWYVSGQFAEADSKAAVTGQLGGQTGV
jgi:hypothetical protein